MEDILLQSEERFRLVVEVSPNAIVLVSSEGLIHLVNTQAEKLFGYKREELLGQPVEMLVPPQFQVHHSHYRDVFFAAPTTRPMGAGRDLFGLCKDGSQVPIEIGLNPLTTTDGSFVLASIIDITERKRAEIELRQTAAELARSNAELEQFAYVVSHDLQEPLRAISGTVQLLQRRYGGRLDGRADELIQHAVEGTARMHRLITDLLAFAKIGGPDTSLRLTDCTAVLTAVLANLDMAIRESGTVVTYDRLPTVMADPTQLGQLFQNLIGNAIKFRGNRPPTINIRTEQKEGECLFAVCDNGIGMDAKDLERIFGVFQRLHTRQEYPGSGIGLAICKKIVERQGGRIWVDSQPGQGSTFYFTLLTGALGE